MLWLRFVPMGTRDKQLSCFEFLYHNKDNIMTRFNYAIDECHYTESYQALLYLIQIKT